MLQNHPLDYLKSQNNQIEDIAYLCSAGSASLNGIGCGSNGDEILKKFEGKVKILCRKKNEEGGASLERLYKVAKYGTNYYLNTNVVVAIMIAEPKTIDSFVGKNWDKCN